MNLRRGLLAGCLTVALVSAGCGDDAKDTTAPVSTTPATTTPATTTAGGSTTTGATTPPPTTTGLTPTTKEALLPADIQVSDADRVFTFSSPTGNIGCGFSNFSDSVQSVRCDIVEREWQPPPKSADCDVDFGQGIKLAAGGVPAFVCAGDTSRNNENPVPYGQSIALGVLRCESETSGMTCRDTESGRGFFLARDTYRLF